MGAAPGAGAAARPVGAAAATPGKVKCDWSAHTAPDGRQYYYNAVTKQSVWKKPPEFAEAERQAEIEAKATAILAACPWREYTAPDGKKYYFNKSLNKSVWKLPPELEEARRKVLELRAGAWPGDAASAQPTNGAAAAATAPGAATPASATAVPRVAPGSGEFMYATKDEAKAAFKAMLTAIGTNVDEKKWDRVLAAAQRSNDPRFKALKSNGERQSCWKEWIADTRAEAKRAEERAAAAKRDRFVEMLESKVGVLGEPGVRFAKCAAICFNDERFVALGEEEGEQVFREWQSARKAAVEAAERAAVEEKMAAFKTLLESRQESDATRIPPTMTWEVLEDQLRSEEAYAACPDVSRLKVWEAFLRKLLEEEQAEWAKEDAARYRQERKKRDAFRDLLRKHRDQGVINAQTPWKRYRDVIRKESEHLALEANTSGSTPKDLFLDLISELGERYHRDKAKLKEVFKDMGFAVTTETEWDDMLIFLNQAEENPKHTSALKEVLDKNKRLYFEDMLERAKTDKQKLHRHLRYAANLVSPEMPWDEARKLLIEKGSISMLKQMNNVDAEAVWNDWALHQKEKKAKREKKDKRDRHERREREREGRSAGRKSSRPDRSPDGGGGDDDSPRRESKRSRHHRDRDASPDYDGERGSRSHAEPHESSGRGRGSVGREGSDFRSQTPVDALPGGGQGGHTRGAREEQLSDASPPPGASPRRASDGVEEGEL